MAPQTNSSSQSFRLGLSTPPPETFPAGVCFHSLFLSTETNSSSQSFRASLFPLKKLSQPELFVAAEQTRLLGDCSRPPKQTRRAGGSELLCSPTQNFPSQGLFVVAETKSGRSLFSASETNSQQAAKFTIHLVGMYELVFFSPPPPRAPAHLHLHLPGLSQRMRVGLSLAKQTPTRTHEFFVETS